MRDVQRFQRCRSSQFATSENLLGHTLPCSLPFVSCPELGLQVSGQHHRTVLGLTFNVAATSAPSCAQAGLNE